MVGLWMGDRGPCQRTSGGLKTLTIGLAIRPIYELIDLDKFLSLVSYFSNWISKLFIYINLIDDYQSSDRFVESAREASQFFNQ